MGKYENGVAIFSFSAVSTAVSLLVAIGLAIEATMAE